MATTTKELTPVEGEVLLPSVKQLRAELTAMEAQFRNALPPHIKWDRFLSVAITAANQNRQLAERCERQSLINALLKCANDGLLPDGKEAVIVPYGTDAEGRGSADTAQYIPMILGLRKKVRNSGALADWNVHVVQEGDVFDYQLGDKPYIIHKPSLRGGRTRKVIAAYSIATYPDGTMSREVMNIDQIEDIRRKSKAKRGPWNDPVFYPEMARKTVARLHAKQLPMSTDLDRLLHADDHLYDIEHGSEERRAVERPGSAARALEWFGKGGTGTPPSPVTGKPATDVADPTAATKAVDDEDTGGAPASATPDAPTPGITLPKTEDDYRDFARALIDEASNADGLEQWWRSEGQRKLRSAAGVGRETFELIDNWVRRRCKELGQ